jgi:LemA protein
MLMLIFLLLTLVSLLLLLGFITSYNHLVRFRAQAAEAWSGMDVQLKRRHDLVPNLVAAVKGYVRHEQASVEAVVQARQAALTVAGVVPRAQAEQALGTAVQGLLALAEAYPDLKASANFLELQKSLTALEDELQLARRYYNAVVREVNIRVDGFPSFLVARLFHFERQSYFEMAGDDRANPGVSF